MAAVLPPAHAPFSTVASTSSPAATQPVSPPPPAATTTSPSAAGASSKSHACPHCAKSYSKRSKLAAHVASSHPLPGAPPPARPFACAHPGCTNAFGRREHLEAHARTHLPESARPFACEKAGCGKRFWTAQHKRRHEAGCGLGGSHQCSECAESFKKDSQLRAHVASSHSAPGTQPFPCPVPSCTRSFPTAQKLKAHAKTHDGARYTCLDPAHAAAGDGGDARPAFATWSALLAHAREAHPPRCHYPECAQRPPFASRKALRNHLRVHREREEDDALLGPERAADADVDDDDDDGDGDERGRGRKRRRSRSASVPAAAGGGTPKLKRRRGESVAGKDWHCGEPACNKAFKTKKALETHIDTAHYALRPWVCPHARTGSCTKAYGHRHLLVRHLSKKHPGTVLGENPLPPALHAPGQQQQQAAAADEQRAARERRAGERLRGALTGLAAVRRPIPCPFAYGDDTAELLGTLGVGRPPADGPGAGAASDEVCDYRCSRAYDLRRHLGTAHGLVLGETEARDVAEALREEVEL